MNGQKFPPWLKTSLAICFILIAFGFGYLLGFLVAYSDIFLNN
jgi:hypothetical protein